MSTRRLVLWLCLSVLCSCASAAQVRRAALDDSAVVDGELDILYRCGERSAEALDLTVAHGNPAARVFITDWTREGAERWRMTYMVRVHERYGPGADAVVMRDVWQVEGPVPDGAEALPESDGGWERSPGTPEDTAFANQVTAAVVECWRAESTLAP